MQQKAALEATEMYKILLTTEAELKVRPLLLWEKLTDSESSFFYWESPSYMWKTASNKDKAFDNKYYNRAISDVKNDDVFKKLLSDYIEKYPNKDDPTFFSIYWWNASNNLYSDALRHSYFNALNSKDFWIETAKIMWDNHENFKWNLWMTVIIDLYNNSIWRQIWEKYSTLSDDKLLEKLVEYNDIFMYWTYNENWEWSWNKIYNDYSSIIEWN